MPARRRRRLRARLHRAARAPRRRARGGGDGAGRGRPLRRRRRRRGAARRRPQRWRRRLQRRLRPLPELMARATASFMLRHPARWFALGFGSGLAPRAPGTVGTLWGWIAFLVLDRWLAPRAWGLV